jgi:hypothetical protein
MSKRIFAALIAGIIGIVFVCCLSSCGNKSANEVQPKKTINLFVDGKKATFEKGYPHIGENNKTMTPVDLFNKYMGANVNVNNEKIVISKDKTTIELKIGESQATINGKALVLPCSVIREDGVVMAPVRIIAEALGATVSWNDANHNVSIATGSSKTP